MPYFTVEVELAAHAKCAACNCELEVGDATFERGKISVCVLPCEVCLVEARDEAEAIATAKAQIEAPFT